MTTILSKCINLLLLPSVCFAGDLNEGVTKVSELIISEYHIDKNIEDYIRKNVPDKYINIATKYGGIAKIITDRKVEIKWNF